LLSRTSKHATSSQTLIGGLAVVFPILWAFNTKPLYADYGESLHLACLCLSAQTPKLGILGVLMMHPWFLHRGWIDGVFCCFHTRVAFFSAELLAMVGSLLSSLLCDAVSLGFLWHACPGIAWGCPPHAYLIVCTLSSLPCVCPVSIECVVGMILVSRWSLLV